MALSPDPHARSPESIAPARTARGADLLAQCHWPSLAPPYDEALREAVAFVADTVDPVGVIATGTIVRGGAHASSDLDVYVIHHAPFRRRIQRFFRGVPAEIFINPSSAIRRYFAEEHRHGRPYSAHMIATGLVVWSSDAIVDELRIEAAQWLARPSVLTEDELVRARYAAATRLEDGMDVGASDPDTATMLLTQAVVAMLEIDCRVKAGRIPRSKELLGTVATRDPELGRLVHTFFATGSYAERQAAAEAIAERVIGVRGFFPWDSGDEPVGQHTDPDA